MAANAIYGGYSLDLTTLATTNGTPVNLHDRTIIGAFLLTDTGTHVGSVSFQVSNDGDNWSDDIQVRNMSTGVYVTSISVASGTANNDFIELETAANFIRAVYTHSSGTGTLSVLFSRKAG